VVTLFVVCAGAVIGSLESKMAEILPSWKSTRRHFYADGGPIWIKFRRLVQNDMSTAVMWSKSKPDVEFQYGGRLGEFNGMSSQSHILHCRVMPLCEFTVTIPQPHATLQGVRIPSAILKIVFRHIFWYLMQFRLWRAAACIVSDTLVSKCQVLVTTLRILNGLLMYSVFSKTSPFCFVELLLEKLTNSNKHLRDYSRMIANSTLLKVTCLFYKYMLLTAM